ncbi:MAG: helix-turn-helix transcriptional regulator [Methylococcales bacterium]|nr:helix-turn-helix transcriptional regulator [Methylococcales bacterium]
MSVHEKIRIIRKAKGLTLEEVAHQLGMSTNGYGDIERGATDVNLSRLVQISQLFDMELSELIDLNEKNVFNILDSQNTGSIGTHNHCTITPDSSESLQLQFVLENQKLIIEQQTQEIAYLKEIIALMKREAG